MGYTITLNDHCSKEIGFMLSINSDINTTTTLDDLSLDWLTTFYELLARQLRLDDTLRTVDYTNCSTNELVKLTAKEYFFKELNKHLGDGSTYTHQKELLNSLAKLYGVFTHPSTTDEQKNFIAKSIEEDVSECTPEFYERVNFTIAMDEHELAAVRDYIKHGADINKAIVLLFSQEHKRDTLYWLHDNLPLLEKLTVVSLNTVIPQGKYQGRTIAETLINTKKGRQLLSESKPLQDVFSDAGLTHSSTIV